MSSSTPITDPKEALLKLFQQAGVTKIAYIDDKFSTTSYEPFFIGTLTAIYRSKQFDDKINFIDFWDVQKPVFDKKIKSLWDSSDNNQRNNYLRSLYTFSGDEAEYTNINAVLQIPILASGLIDTYSPEEWTKKKDSFFKQNITKKGQRVICLFDKDLRSVRDGIEFLKEVLESEFKNRVYCAVLSQHVSLGDEYVSKKRWIDEFSLSKIATKFYPISKGTINENPVWGFIEGIKNILIVEEVEKLKRQSAKIIKDSQKRVLKEIDELSPETYNQIIQRSSGIEGTWEMNTLFRISTLIQDSSLKSSILSSGVRSNFNSSILTIRSFDQIKFDQENVHLSEQTKRLQQNEVFESGDVINSLHFPLANGDIFKIKSKEYILIAQPCNISMRDGGKRDNDYELATLVQIINEDKGNNSAQIEYHEQWVKFSANYLIKFDVLDLAVFNKNGYCLIEYEKGLEEKELFHTPLLDRYTKLSKIYNGCAKRIMDIEDILDKSKVKKSQYLPLLKPVISLNSNLKTEFEFIKAENKFDFKITRIKRLKEPYSIDILQKYMQYQARNAFEHDITRTK